MDFLKSMSPMGALIMVGVYIVLIWIGLLFSYSSILFFDGETICTKIGYPTSPYLELVHLPFYIVSGIVFYIFWKLPIKV